MVLYRRRNAGWEYWEAWPERSGHLLVHRGRVGERGVAEHILVSVIGAEERLSALVRHQLRRGYRQADMCELGLVLVQWPGEQAYAHLHGRAAAWMRDVLGWTGLGSYDGRGGRGAPRDGRRRDLAMTKLTAAMFVR